jgi:hypothetical protein
MADPHNEVIVLCLLVDGPLILPDNLVTPAPDAVGRCSIGPTRIPVGRCVPPARCPRLSMGPKPWRRRG